MRLFLALWMAISAAPAQAIERVSPEAFLDFAKGKTLTFSIIGGGQIVGIEDFLSR